MLSSPLEQCSFPVRTLQQLSTLLNQGKKVAVFCYVRVMAICFFEVCSCVSIRWLLYFFKYGAKCFAKGHVDFHSCIYLCMPRAPSSLTYCFACLDTKYVNVVATVVNIAFSIVKYLSYMALRKKSLALFYFGSLLNSI